MSNSGFQQDIDSRGVGTLLQLLAEAKKHGLAPENCEISVRGQCWFYDRWMLRTGMLSGLETPEPEIPYIKSLRSKPKIEKTTIEKMFEEAIRDLNVKIPTDCDRWRNGTDKHHGENVLCAKTSMAVNIMECDIGRFLDRIQSNTGSSMGTFLNLWIDCGSDAELFRSGGHRAAISTIVGMTGYALGFLGLMTSAMKSIYLFGLTDTHVYCSLSRHLHVCEWLVRQLRFGFLRYGVDGSYDL